MLRYTIILSFIFLFGFVNGQNVEFKNSNFKDKKEGLKTAVSNIETADGLMEKGFLELKKNENHSLSFLQALDLYKKADNFNPSNAELNYKIGMCFLFTPDKKAALAYLEKSIKLDPESNPDVYLQYGRALKFDYKYEKASEQFKKYRTKLSSKEQQAKSILIKKELAECKNGIEFLNKPSRVWIDNLDAINTSYPEYCATITADESVLIFNTRCPDNTGGATNSNNKYYADIYISNRDGKTWSKPKKISNILNKPQDDECVALSPDGQRMFLVREKNGNLDLYKSTRFGENWTEPVSLAQNRINTEHNESHASFSTYNIKVYFVTDNPYANRGGTDLFFSGRVNMRHGEEWGNASTVGKEVNTLYNESCIFLHPDGNTLYFSSKGHNSMGGYDIFKCTRLPGRWSEPVNLGYPVNTPYDEKYITVSASGKHGYITSNRKKDNKGDFDIYRVTFLGPEKPMMSDTEDRLISSISKSVKESSLEGPVEIEANHLTVLRGRVVDEFTKEPVEATIEIVDNVKNEVITTLQSNSKTGKFLVSLPAGINYGIAIDAEDYLFYSENFDLPEMSDYQLVTKDIYLQNICIGCKIVLRNVFFGTGKHTLRPESTPELERLFKLLKNIPRLKVEISGHT
ncbi:MAG: hypothetical protein K8R53_02305, partial [Bacteroidales bacterium]|nr:hypothetical protein [Bacteroidales bacterium]